MGISPLQAIVFAFKSKVISEQKPYGLALPRQTPLLNKVTLLRKKMQLHIDPAFSAVISSNS